MRIPSFDPPFHRSVKYAVVTFGCRVNQADSHGLEEELRASGARRRPIGLMWSWSTHVRSRLRPTKVRVKPFAASLVSTPEPASW